MNLNFISLKAGERATAPDTAWIMLLEQRRGRALDVYVKAIEAYTGKFDIKRLLQRIPTGTFAWSNEPNDNPSPSAISLKIQRPMYLGFILSERLGASFAEEAFSGGYPGADKDYYGGTRVSATTAYLAVDNARFEGRSGYRPFNINLLVDGRFRDGTKYQTPIILDPDMRWPDGGVPR